MDAPRQSAASSPPLNRRKSATIGRASRSRTLFRDPCGSPAPFPLSFRWITRRLSGKPTATDAFFQRATKERLMGISIGISTPQNDFATSGISALNGSGFQSDAASGANTNTQALDQMLAMLIMMMLQNSAQNDGSQDDGGLSGGMPGAGNPNGATGSPAQMAGGQNITQELMQILMQLMMNQMQRGSGSTMSA
ncbi:hypothetical protein [Burkholderia cepacia]|nr:hypothetical protein [Burkholderia cepacia]